jgi:hypothetical protein
MSIEKQFEQKHYAEVPVEVTAQDAGVAFAAFDSLISLPLEYRQAGDYEIPTKTTGGFGYRRRVAGHSGQGRDVSTDTKHVYHFGSNTRQVFEGFGWQRTPREVKEFCDIVEHLYWAGVAALRQTVAVMRDEQSPVNIHAPNLWPLFYDRFHFPDIHLRLNAYERPAAESAYLGSRHLDRSALTLGIIPSPGLEFGVSADGSDAVPADTQPGYAQFFAGGGWHKLPREYQASYSYVHPAVHGVRQTSHDHVSQSGSILGHSAVMLANPWELATDIPFATTKPGISQQPDMAVVAA